MNDLNTIQRDFKSQAVGDKKKNTGKRHSLLILAGGLLGLGIVLSIASFDATARRETVSSTTRDMISTPLPLPAGEAATTDSTPAQTEAGPVQSGQWHTVKVRSGDSLSTIFDHYKLSPQQLQDVLAVQDAKKMLTRLYPGDELNLYISDQQRLLGLRYDVDETRTYQIATSTRGLDGQIINKPVEMRVAHATGVINDSLFLAAQKAGLSDNLTMELAGIFGWDVDFALDIRQGDSFSVIYEEVYQHGRKLRDGKILAAEFVNQGHSYRAVRYTDANNRTDYYSTDGKSMRKAFLRTPVAFSRISSRFNLKRKHPILNRIRAHKGVDYAAPRGTPVKATGDGKVIMRRVNGGYGKTIIIQHGSRYSTLYGHLNGYARGIHYGTHVRQGQVIAYVGSTGLATGPHLHYEFRINGVHRNPLTVKLPDAAPLAAKYHADFDASIQPYLAQLDTLKRMMVALQDN